MIAQILYELFEFKDLGDSLLPRSDLDGQSTDLGVLVGGVTVKRSPMVEDSLGEGLSTGSLSQVGVETEGLGDG